MAITLAEAIPCDHGSLCSHSREAARLAFAAIAPLVLERAARECEFGVAGRIEVNQGLLVAADRIRALKTKP